MKTFRLLTVIAALALALGAFTDDAVAQSRDRDREEPCECHERDGVRSCTCFGGDFDFFPTIGQFANRARLGISVSTSQSLDDDAFGVVIDEVEEDSPADEAGLRVGDIIVSVEGMSLTEPIEDDLEEDLDPDESLPAQRLLAIARDFEEGEAVEVRYLRDGQERVVDIEPENRFDFDFSFAEEWDSEEFAAMMDRVRELGDRVGSGVYWTPPDAPVWTTPDVSFFRDSNSHRCPGAGSGAVYLGMSGATRGCVSGVEFRELNPRLGEYFGTETGILVIDVADDASLGLMPGDVVLSIDGREVDDIDRLRRILGSYGDDEDVSFEVMRKGAETSVRGSIN